MREIKSKNVNWTNLIWVIQSQKHNSVALPINEQNCGWERAYWIHWDIAYKSTENFYIFIDKCY